MSYAAEIVAAPVDGSANSSARREPGPMERKAAGIHRLGRLRAKHFPTSVLSDRKMDILLSLFVGEQQGTLLSDRTLALANQLSREEANSAIEELVHAGLAVITGNEPERRTVGLTPIGSARTRGFVDDHPGV